MNRIRQNGGQIMLEVYVSDCCPRFIPNPAFVGEKLCAYFVKYEDFIIYRSIEETERKNYLRKLIYMQIGERVYKEWTRPKSQSTWGIHGGNIEETAYWKDKFNE